MSLDFYWLLGVVVLSWMAGVAGGIVLTIYMAIPYPPKSPGEEVYECWDCRELVRPEEEVIKLHHPGQHTLAKVTVTSGWDSDRKEGAMALDHPMLRKIEKRLP